jgi:hypothetical protein
MIVRGRGFRQIADGLHLRYVTGLATGARSHTAAGNAIHRPR